MPGHIESDAKQFDAVGGLDMVKQLAADFLFNKVIVPEQLSAQAEQELFYPKLTDAKEELVNTSLGLINVTHGGNKNGKALVLWPSLMMKGSMFAPQYEHFRHTHYVLLIDSPGINKSDPLRKLIDLKQCKDAVVEILDHFKIDKCIFGGNSWGAMMAGIVASNKPGWGMPDRLYGSIVVNGTASAPTLPETVMMTIRAEALTMNQHVPDWWIRLAQDAFAGGYAKEHRPEFMNYIRCVGKEDPKSIAWAIKGILIGRIDTHDICNQVKDVPVLVLAGAQDQQFSVDMVKSYADAIPTSKFVVIPDTAHLASRENPEGVNKEMDKWFQEIGF